jgi:hypothetical protein
MAAHRVLAGMGLLCASSVAFAGVTFTQVTTVDGKRTTVMKVSAEGTSAKLETVEAPDNPFMPAGSYLLFTDGDMLLVNPAARTYARFDTSMLDSMGQMAGQMQFNDVKFEKTVDEPGETIGGYATRHYQFKSSWTMTMQGMPMKTESSTVEDLWTTTEIEMPALPSLGSSGAMPAQVTAIAENQGLRNVEGLPLKHVTVQSTKTDMGMGALGGIAGFGARMMSGGRGGRGGRGGGDAGGGAPGGDSTTTIEAEDIEEVDVPASTFELPAGYSETSLFQTGPAIPSLNGVQEAPPAVPSLNDLDE